MDDREIIDEFHKLYGRTLKSRLLHEHTFWMGMNLIKTPLDLWAYQEIIYEKKPDVITKRKGLDEGDTSCHSNS